MIRLLHLSDVHFGMMNAGNQAASTHRFIDSTMRKPDPVALADILKRDGKIGTTDFVVISGDLGWTGSSEDYEYAIEFLSNLADLVPIEQIVLAPGNHDVDRSPDVEDDARQKDYERLVREFYGSYWAKFYPALAARPPALSPREHLIGVHSTKDALAISVNSAALQNVASTPIAIRPQVLRYAEGLLDQHANHERSKLRIFVLHHHLFPFIEPAWDDQVDIHEVIDQPDPTMLSNSARVQHWLSRHGFSLVLHGHKHIHHGREDRLWRPSIAQEDRSLVIVGCGSSGVSNQARPHDEPLNLNVIDASATARSSWRIQVDARRIDEAEMPTSAMPWFRYTATAGRGFADPTHVFSAERMDDCHAEISSTLQGYGPVRNFLSVVADSAYIHPASARLGDREPSRQDVETCFRSLHPEYSSAEGWEDDGLVDEALLHRRERLEHGSRLFQKSANGVSPLKVAIRMVDQRPTWAYVGLYRPTLDTEQQPRPMPGLMSVQLIPDRDQRRLDLVATFRNLELSFWWVVNMMEMRKLLEYAAARCEGRLAPGSVTLFSAIAEWKADPAPVLTARLDDLALGDLLKMSLQIRESHPRAADDLADLLDDKASRMTRYNTDLTGLRNLIAALSAAESVPRRKGRTLQPLIDILVDARGRITSKTLDRADSAQAARNLLSRAAGHLRDIVIREV